ncbi:MAG TPA: hypothetical protein ENN80_01770 [Candidatus Hydrogenedentes bacterium]|nr:hypothetical protein [Candidatus Hydrogenedentota bacterium]
MPGLQPTLVIGLGSTGLDIVDYFRQFLLEEFGTSDIPCIQTLVFETVESAHSRTGASVTPLTIESTDRVHFKMANPEPDEESKVKEYHKWLPGFVFDMGDSFRVGAGSCRSAGRLIFWENWDKARDAVTHAFDQSMDPDRIKEATNLLLRHYKDSKIPMAAEDQPVNTATPLIYVVGTLCGGTCSGMLADLGFLLRSLGASIKRVLCVSMLTRPQTADLRMLKPAANCYGALKEADFYFQQLPPNSWEYLLPDGATKVQTGEFPYDRVYAVSSYNGTTQLGETGVNQMLAMNLFLDVVGGGRTAKDAAIVDGTGQPRDQQGYMRQFYSFGLSAVWYPKLKITGLAACDLGMELCDKWLGDETELKESEIKQQVQRDFEDLVGNIEAQIKSEVDAKIKELQGAQGKALTRSAKGEGGDDVLGKERQDDIRQALLNTDARMKEIVRAASERIESQLTTRLYSTYKDCAAASRYWGLYKKAVEDKVGGKEEEAGGAKTTLTADDVIVEPDTGKLASSRRRIRQAADDIWVRLVFKRKEAEDYYRSRYLEDYVAAWSESTDKFKDSRTEVVLRLLRHSPEDADLFRRYDYSAEEEERNAFRTNEQRLARVSQRIGTVKGTLQDWRSEFKGLGGARIVHAVYRHGSDEADAEENKRAIRKSIVPPAVSVAWHLAEGRNMTRMPDEKAFWENQKAEAIAYVLRANYQRAGFGQLSPNQATTADLSTLKNLLDNAKPYQQFNERFVPVRYFRSPKYVFGGQDDPELRKIAKELNIDETQCRATGLRHMLFLYHEERCFAVDMLSAFDTAERRAEQHYPFTHKDNSFFDWRRFENKRMAQVILDAAHLLFPEKIFTETGGQRVVLITVRGTPQVFSPGSAESYEKLAETPVALNTLKDMVKDVLRKMSVEEFKSLHETKAAQLMTAKLSEQASPKDRETFQAQIDVLGDFRQTFASQIFPELIEEDKQQA